MTIRWELPFDPTLGLGPKKSDPTVGLFGQSNPTVGFFGQSDPTVGLICMIPYTGN